MKTGTAQKCKTNTLKQQREAAELELIIEDFARNMRNANRMYIASQLIGGPPRFTMNQACVWNRYVVFCGDHPQ